MPFLINITSYISSLSKNVFNTKLINQSEIANIICLNLSYLFLVYPANSKSTIMTQSDNSDEKRTVEVVYTLKRVITRQNKILSAYPEPSMSTENVFIVIIFRQTYGVIL